MLNFNLKVYSNTIIVVLNMDTIVVVNMLDFEVFN